MPRHMLQKLLFFLGTVSLLLQHGADPNKILPIVYSTLSEDIKYVLKTESLRPDLRGQVQPPLTDVRYSNPPTTAPHHHGGLGQQIVAAAKVGKEVVEIAETGKKAYDIISGL